MDFKKLKSNYPGIIIALGIAFFWRIFVERGLITHTWSDILSEFYPLKHFLVNSILTYGEIPQRIPSLFSGMPFLANSQVGTFFPFSLIFFIPPLEFSFSLYFLTYIIVTGLATYFFMLEIGAKKYPAFLAAVIYMFSGSTIGMIQQGHVATAGTMMLFPVVLLFFERMYRKKSIEYAVFLGAVLGAQILAGYPQVVIYSLLTIALYSIFLYWRDRPDNKSVVKLVSFLVLAGIIMFGVSAVQLLPSIELLQSSIRSEGLPLSVAGTPPDLRSFVNIVFPEALGTIFTETCFFGPKSCHIFFYVGSFTLFLAGLAAAANKSFESEKKNYIRFFGFLSVLTFLYTLGNYTHIHSILYRLPLLSMLRLPYRAVFIYAFSLSVLAGFGAQILIGGKSGITRHNAEKFVRIGEKIFLLLTIGMIVGYLGLVVFRAPILEFGETLAKSQFEAYNSFEHYTTIYSLDHYLGLVQVIYQDTLLRLFIYAATFGGGYLILRSALHGVNKENLQLFLLVLMLFSLWTVGMKYVTLMPMEEVNELNPALEIIGSDSELFRVMSLIEATPQDPLHQEKLITRNIENALGFEAMELNEYGELMELALDRPGWAKPTIEHVRNMNLISLLNVKYLVFPSDSNISEYVTPAGEEFVEVVYQNEYTVVENTNYLPRYMVVPGAVIEPERSQRLRLIDSKRDFTRSVVLNEAPKSGFVSESDSVGSVIVIERTPNRITLAIESNGDAYLFASEPYYPAWRAYLNGKESEVLVANHAFLAVPINAQTKEVVLQYDSRQYRLGKIISCATALTILAFILIKRFKNRGILSKKND